MGLIIDNITVKVGQKKVLDHFHLEIQDGEIHALMGPNGVGKSTLSKVIMGSKDYEVISGDILYQEESILSLETNERAQRGIFLSMQNPISIEGVTNSEFLRTALSSIRKEQVPLYEFILSLEKNIKELHMDKNVAHRFINQGFSGGERKKNEILQLKLLEPSFLIFDELDSGLDVDSLKIVCENILQYKKEHPKTSILIITHYPRILEYLHPDYVHMMQDGHIVETGDFRLALKIEKEGYCRQSAMDEMIENE